MNKIIRIFIREYSTRVRKRAFIVMSIVGPLLFAVLLIAPYKLASLEDKERKLFAVVELDSVLQPVSKNKMLFNEVIPSKENLQFQYLPDTDTTTIKTLVEYSGYDAVVVLNHSLLEATNAEIDVYTKKQQSIGVEMYINQHIERFLFEKKLQDYKLNSEQINSCKTRILMNTHRLEKGSFKEQNLLNLRRGISYASGFMVYFFIFFFGAQVMRGVIEEKTSRIIEVIITSVRPFQLMMGKIIGIALVGLTQFAIWIVLTLILYQGALHSIISLPDLTPASAAMEQAQESGNIPGVLHAVSGITMSYYLYLLGMFIFYFVFGYLLYGSLFAAIGSAVDSETDTQQFMLPVTIPLIISIIVMINAITNPEGQLVFWFSMIPFTSPVVMMARVPFNPPVSELLASMVLLIVTFLATTWAAGKIYRTGILMYGKRASFREILKWVKYKG